MRRTNSHASLTPLRSAFTLVEVLVVAAIIMLMIAILLPTVRLAQESARSAQCMSNLKQIGIAIVSYANSNRGNIPFGPKAPPMTSGANFYPSTGAPTSLISLWNGSPVGLGLLLQDYLSRSPKVLFCPSSDQQESADAHLSRVGISQVQCSYYYRHASVTAMVDTPASLRAAPNYIELANLNVNREGKKIRALAMDTQFVVPPSFASFGVTPRTHHQQKAVNVLYSDGHVETRHNLDKRFDVNLDNYTAMMSAFSVILRVLERADSEF